MPRYAYFLLIIFTSLSASRCKSLSSSNPVVEISTKYGIIGVEIYIDKAPVTANNFLEYIKRNMYDRACFYRVVKPDNQPDNEIKIEVIQAGLGFVDSLPGLAPIEHESTLKTGIKHKNGTISMARLEPGTASSEFFICIDDQPELDYGGKRNPDGQGFAAFGKVIQGMGVVRRIQRLPDTNQMLNSPVIISAIKIIR